MQFQHKQSRIHTTQKTETFCNNTFHKAHDLLRLKKIIIPKMLLWLPWFSYCLIKNVTLCSGKRSIMCFLKRLETWCMFFNCHKREHWEGGECFLHPSGGVQSHKTMLSTVSFGLPTGWPALAKVPHCRLSHVDGIVQGGIKPSMSCSKVCPDVASIVSVTQIAAGPGESQRNISRGKPTGGSAGSRSVRGSGKV